jgi:hypothetical protein
MTLRNLVAQYSTTTGTGDVLLDGAVKTNCRAVTSAYSVDQIGSFTMLDTATGDSMVFRGKLKGSPDRLEIVSVRLALGPNASSPTAAVDWQAGEKLVVNDGAAEDLAPQIRAGAIGDPALEQWGLPFASHFTSGFGTLTLTANTSTALVFQCVENVVVKEMKLRISTFGAAGTFIQFALRRASFVPPAAVTLGDVLADSGALSASATNAKVVTGLSVELTRGELYAVEAVSTGTPALSTLQYAQFAGMSWDGSTNAINRISRYTATSSYPITSTPLSVSPVDTTAFANFVAPVGLRWEKLP